MIGVLYSNYAGKQVKGMETHQELLDKIAANPFYVDEHHAGVVRGGFFDAMGGMLVGTHAPFVAEALNYYGRLGAKHLDKLPDDFDVTPRYRE